MVCRISLARMAFMIHGSGWFGSELVSRQRMRNFQLDVWMFLRLCKSFCKALVWSPGSASNAGLS